jgi:hypothetical protein
MALPEWEGGGGRGGMIGSAGLGLTCTAGVSGGEKEIEVKMDLH